MTEPTPEKERAGFDEGGYWHDCPLHPIVTHCESIVNGSICPDDLCRNASDKTLCGAWVEDLGYDNSDDEDYYGAESDRRLVAALESIHGMGPDRSINDARQVAWDAIRHLETMTKVSTNNDKSQLSKSGDMDV